MVLDKNKGCYRLPGDLEPLVTDHPAMSVLMCIELCRGLSFQFAAVSQMDCYCVHLLMDLEDQQTASNCSSICPGNTIQLCGAASLATVLHIGIFTLHIRYTCIYIP